MHLRNILFCLFFLTSVNSAFADVRLPQLIRDSMVLQRDSKIHIWGWASANEKVRIKFLKKAYKVTADNKGKWSINCSPQKAGGPYNMLIDGNNHIELKGILIGDVWICSGQSNMVHQMILHVDLYEDEISKANYSEIREFIVPTVYDLGKPHDDLPSGSWKSANPNDVAQFSAVAYFFAKTIYQKYHIPIGLINTSFGGPGIEAWMSETSLQQFPKPYNTFIKNKDTGYVNSIDRASGLSYRNKRKIQDKGLTGTPWYDTAYIAKGWHSIYIPGYWEDQGIKDLDGVVWYRKEIEIPSSMTDIPVKVFLGRIVDEDYLYINGKLVGNTSYQYPQRRYVVPAGTLKQGRNTFVIRVINHSDKGGFVPDKPYYIKAGDQKVDLTGEWKYKMGDAFPPGNKSVSPIAKEYQPAALFNGMIAPLTNYSIKGILWYQGEGNISNASDYEKLLPVMIRDWRSRWRLGDVPFLYVQLPNFGEKTYLPTESGWAILREAQLKSLSVPNTGMAVTIDVGEWNDIHPLNKKDVGIRLALAAEKVAYNEDIVSTGPLFQSSEIVQNKIIISFNNGGSSLVSIDGEALSQFAIAGADKKFVWAKAKIDGNKVIIWNDEILNPVYVRYAWADNPEGANLYNKEGLPASPFRTDQ